MWLLGPRLMFSSSDLCESVRSVYHFHSDFTEKRPEDWYTDFQDQHRSEPEWVAFASGDSNLPLDPNHPHELFRETTP